MCEAFEHTEIINAAKSRDYQKVRELMEAGADVCACNGLEQNALYFALLGRERELAGQLYDAGASLDCLTDGTGTWNVLAVIAELFRCGKNPFLDDAHSLADCCSWGLYTQAQEKNSNGINRRKKRGSCCSV